MTTIPLKSVGYPTSPGAYIINSGNGAHPIFCSVANLGDIGMNDNNDYFLVLPNYSLQVWQDANYSKNPVFYTQSSTVQIFTSLYTNTASSLNLYYNGTEVTISGLS